MLKFIAACGSGLGSSLMVSMNVTKVLKELGVEAEVEHSDISNAGYSVCGEVKL